MNPWAQGLIVVHLLQTAYSNLPVLESSKMYTSQTKELSGCEGKRWVFQGGIFRPWIPGVLCLYHGIDLDWTCSCVQGQCTGSAALLPSPEGLAHPAVCLPLSRPLHLQHIDPYAMLFKGLSCIILSCPKPGDRTMKQFSDNSWVYIYCVYLLLWLKYF